MIKYIAPNAYKYTILESFTISLIYKFFSSFPHGTCSLSIILNYIRFSKWFYYIQTTNTSNHLTIIYMEIKLYRLIPFYEKCFNGFQV